MSHIKKDAPEGFIYRYKGIDNEYASTAYIGGGRSEDDYELITIAEYERILKEQNLTEI